MKKPNNNIQSPKQFFELVKQCMKIGSTNRIELSKLKNFNYNHQQTTLGRLVDYIQGKTKINKNMDNTECVKILNNLFEKETAILERFKIDLDGITYISKYAKIVDQKTLLKQIENTPEGIPVDDQLLKFSAKAINTYINQLINSRSIIPVKSKGVEKSKMKDYNYEGYILFPFPPEVKQSMKTVFKNSLQSSKYQNIQLERDRQKKLEKIYSTKTAYFRKNFQDICSANINKGQQKIGGRENEELFQAKFSTWDQKNKKSIPNFLIEAEQWFKNRK